MDDGTKPTISRRTAGASLSGKRKNPDRDTRAKPAGTEQKPVETEQKPVETNQKPVKADQKPVKADQKPTEAGPRTASTSLPAKQKNPHRDTRPKPAGTEQKPTEADNNFAEADQSPAGAGRARGTVPCADPLAALWDLALLPPRMAMAATIEALKMLAPREDDTRQFLRPLRPQLEEPDATE